MIPKAECQINKPDGAKAKLLDALTGLAITYADPKYGPTTTLPVPRRTIEPVQQRHIVPCRKNPDWAFSYTVNWDKLGYRAPDHLLSLFSRDSTLKARLENRVNIIPSSANAFLSPVLKAPGEMTPGRAKAISEFVCQQVLDTRGTQFIDLQPEPLAAALQGEAVRGPQGALYIMPALNSNAIPFSGPRTLGHLTEKILSL